MRNRVRGKGNFEWGTNGKIKKNLWQNKKKTYGKRKKTHGKKKKPHGKKKKTHGKRKKNLTAKRITSGQK